jgi:PleD family two-component response regulator
VTSRHNTVASTHRSRLNWLDFVVFEVAVLPDEPSNPDPRPLILIANDQEWTGRAVETILAANGYRVVYAYTAREALEVAAREDPDLVLLDQQLPDFTGAEVCRQLRANPRFGPSLPVIITTAGPSGRPQRMNAYAAGAWEFYGQPLDSEALLHKMSVYLAAYAETRELRRGAFLDGATGLYNQSGLMRRATEVIADARRLGRAVACVGWSLNGGADGAQMAHAAAAFRASGRAADALGRLDSGEFAVVTAGITPSGAGRLAARFQGILASAIGGATDQVRTTVVAEEDATRLPSDGEALVRRLSLAFAV